MDTDPFKLSYGISAFSKCILFIYFIIINIVGSIMICKQLRVLCLSIICHCILLLLIILAGLDESMIPGLLLRGWGFYWSTWCLYFCHRRGHSNLQQFLESMSICVHPIQLLNLRVKPKPDCPNISIQIPWLNSFHHHHHPQTTTSWWITQSHGSWLLMALFIWLHFVWNYDFRTKKSQ